MAKAGKSAKQVKEKLEVAGVQTGNPFEVLNLGPGDDPTEEWEKDDDNEKELGKKCAYGFAKIG